MSFNWLSKAECDKNFGKIVRISLKEVVGTSEDLFFFLVNLFTAHLTKIEDDKKYGKMKSG